MTRSWLLDFDETLASGGITWGLKYAFPRLIEQHQLRRDPALFDQAVLVAQERGSQDHNPQQILYDMFETLGWPHDLEAPLMQDIMTNYQPELFEDVIPFLEHVRNREHQVYVVSNNPLASAHIRTLNLDSYIAGVFTVKMYPHCQPKPHRSLWDQIINLHPEIEEGSSTIVGDDPWSDGVFAENCGLDCWIIDRMNRFATLREQKPYRWAQSLLQIPLAD